MLYWFRSKASGIAATLLLSLATLGGSAVVHQEDDCHDDPACRAIVEHDATAHRITTPPTVTDTHPLHCLVCHWTRTFRPHITARFVAAPVVLARIYARFDLITVARNAQVAQPPLRSPPAPPADA
jgi:hypothetical protein